MGFHLKTESDIFRSWFVLIPQGKAFISSDFIYQNKTCVQTLESHVQNVTCVCFHPELPVILTGSEDGE